MKIAFFSSVLNHHQIEFCDAMYSIYGDDFTFVSTMDLETQRVNLGYSLFDRNYNLCMHKSDEERKKAEKLFQDADVVILGVNLKAWLKKRLKSNKVTFLYKERLFKEKPSLYWWTNCLLYVMREYYPHRRKPFYMLAASAYSLPDYRSLGFFVGKTFQWGYFPPFKEQNIETLMEKKKNSYINILWVGRLISLKHPEYALYLAEFLKTKDIDFHINIIGTGPLEEKLRQYVKERKLDDCVFIIGALPPQEVRQWMEKSNILLFTSDRNEGWGAVINEAMNSACAVVASETAGATNFIIEDGVNGKIYKNDSFEEFKDIVLNLVKDYDSIEKLGAAAYLSIKNMQNAEIAAKRFSKVVEAIVSGEELPKYDSGPMSKVL